MTTNEAIEINKYMAAPYRLVFTADEALRVKNIFVSPTIAYAVLGDVSSCKHVYNYYWRRGKCKGSKCILCGHIDKSKKPNAS